MEMKSTSAFAVQVGKVSWVHLLCQRNWGPNGNVCTSQVQSALQEVNVFVRLVSIAWLQ
jgi:hypothetical protein